MDFCAFRDYFIDIVQRKKKEMHSLDLETLLIRYIHILNGPIVKINKFIKTLVQLNK